MNGKRLVFAVTLIGTMLAVMHAIASAKRYKCQWRWITGAQVEFDETARAL